VASFRYKMVAKALRDIERLVIGRGAGRAQTETPSSPPPHQRTTMGSIFTQRMPFFDGVLMNRCIAIRHREPIVEKGHLELAFLQHAAEVGVVFGAPCVSARSRMPQELTRFVQFCAAKIQPSPFDAS